MEKNKQKLYGVLLICLYILFDIIRGVPMSGYCGFLGVSNILPIIYGLMFSYTGALYVLLGNLAADFLAGYPVSFAKAIAAASVSAVGYALWVTIKGERALKTPKGLARYLLISAITSLCAAVIFAALSSAGGLSFSLRPIIITFISFFIWQLLFSAPIISMLVSLFYVFPENLETFSRYPLFSSEFELSLEKMGELVKNITAFCKENNMDRRKTYFIPMCIEEILLFLKENNASKIEIAFAASDAVYIRIVYDGPPINVFGLKSSHFENDENSRLMGIKNVKEIAIKIRHKYVDRNILEIII